MTRSSAPNVPGERDRAGCGDGRRGSVAFCNAQPKHLGSAEHAETAPPTDTRKHVVPLVLTRDIVQNTGKCVGLSAMHTGCAELAGQTRTTRISPITDSHVVSVAFKNGKRIYESHGDAFHTLNQSWKACSPCLLTARVDRRVGRAHRGVNPMSERSPNVNNSQHESLWRHPCAVR